LIYSVTTQNNYVQLWGVTGRLIVEQEFLKTVGNYSQYFIKYSSECHAIHDIQQNNCWTIRT